MFLSRTPGTRRCWARNRIANTRPQPFSPSTGVWLLLVEGGDPTPDKPDVVFLPPDARRASHSFTVRVETCQASYETLKGRSAEFMTPPYDWGGEIRCFFTDPDGHLWEISQLTA